MKKLLLACGLGCVATALLVAEDRVVTVRVETGAAAFALRVVNDVDPTAGDRLQQTSSHQWTWRCEAGDLLSLDALGFEPIDVSNPACKSKEIALIPEPSRAIRIDAEAREEPAIVDWLREGPRGSELIARRRIENLSAAALPVAFTDRIVRVRRAEAAPVSVFVGRDAVVRAIAVPPKVAGGELFARLPNVSVRPDAFVLDGPQGRTVVAPDGTGHVDAIGLAPGSYALAPRYAGGLHGTSIPLRIEHTATSELLPIDLPTVGGVALHVDGELLTAGPLSLDVRRLVRSGATDANQRIASVTADGASNVWRFEGLVPGRYDVVAKDRTGLRASVGFDVPPDKVTTARLLTPRSHVTGTVWFGDKPAGHVILAFFAADQKEWRAETNARGEYEVALSVPGAYTVHVSPRPFMSSMSRPAKIVEGENRLDLKFGSGTIHLRVKRRDGLPIGEIVSIHLRGIFSTQDGFIEPSSDGTDIDLGGLLPGAYTVSADTPSGLVSTETAAVSLDKNGSEIDVELLLDDYRGTLEVRDESGHPLDGVTIITDGIKLPEPVPGSFRLTRVAPGTPLLFLRPPYIPVCRVLALSDFPLMIVTMVSGTETGVIKLTPARNAAVGYVADLPGSNCDVPLFRMAVDFKDQDDGTIIYVHGLRSGTLRYHPTLASAYKPWIVPGPPVTFRRAAARE